MNRTHGRAKDCSLPPQPFKPCRIGGRVPDGVLNVPVSQVVLNQPRVGALVGQGNAARMAQYVRVCINGQTCTSAIITDHEPYGLPAEWAASLTEQERVALWLHLRPLAASSPSRPAMS